MHHLFQRTGFLIDAKGYMITNAHVLKGKPLLLPIKGRTISCKNLHDRMRKTETSLFLEIED
jgi:hypothetical protein